MRSKLFTTVLAAIIVGSFGFVAYTDAVSIYEDLHRQEQEIQRLNIESEQLDKQLEKTREAKEKTQEEVKQKEEEEKKLKEEIEKLNQELQAKKESEARLARASERVINTATQTQTASASAQSGLRSGCGDNQYAAYIYGVESGGRVTGNCDTTATNAGGCYGIGQACPAKHEVRNTCGADYACQNRWFTNYAMERYGSWASAYNFHKANGWW